MNASTDRLAFSKIMRLEITFVAVPALTMSCSKFFKFHLFSFKMTGFMQMYNLSTLAVIADLIGGLPFELRFSSCLWRLSLIKVCLISPLQLSTFNIIVVPYNNDIISYLADGVAASLTRTDKWRCSKSQPFFHCLVNCAALFGACFLKLTVWKVPPAPG